jgi:hypothetical protein
MIGALVLLTALALSTPSAAQSTGLGTEGAVDALLAKAASTEPGTYIVTDAGIERSPIDVPMVAQSDVLKGADKTTLVAVAVGTQVPRAAIVHLRLVTAGAGASVVGDATGSGQPGHVRLVHEFTLAPGEYELHSVVGHPRPEGGTLAALAKTRVTVPDVWNGQLALTPIVIGDAAAIAQRQGPFSFGSTTLSPAVSRHFRQDGALNVAFRVFNWTEGTGPASAATAKPDLNVEYVFYEVTETRLAFFNKVKPQQLTAETLGDKFDPSQRALAAGISLPLAAFPFGEFEMEVRVTDNRSRRTSEQQVRFVVAP